MTESSTVELKREYTPDIRRAVVAFANTAGGSIYIGIEDDGQVTGVDDPDAVSLQVINSCRDSIRPDVTMFLQCETVMMQGMPVVCLQIQRGSGRPYYLAEKGLKPGGVLVRQGPSTAPASEAAIRRMIMETDGDRFEDLRALNQSLTFTAAEKAFGKRALAFGPAQKKSLGLVNEDDLYTNLALLLSDQCPHIIKAAVFRGFGHADFQDRREFSGSLLQQLEDAYAYLDLQNRNRAEFHGLYRSDSRDYPETAVREALLNAIIHRDYSRPAPTLLSVMDDRIEMVSFGGLPGDILLDDVLLGLSVCRNPRLAEVFYRLQLIEAYGTGLRKMQEAYEGTGVEPGLIPSANAFKVVLPNVHALSAGNLNPQKSVRSSPVAYGTAASAREEAVLAMAREKGSIVRADVEERLQLSQASAILILREMTQKGLLVKEGGSRNISYHCP